MSAIGTMRILVSRTPQRYKMCSFVKPPNPNKQHFSKMVKANELYNSQMIHCYTEYNVKLIINDEVLLKSR